MYICVFDTCFGGLKKVTAQKLASQPLACHLLGAPQWPLADFNISVVNVSVFYVWVSNVSVFNKSSPVSHLHATFWGLPFCGPALQYCIYYSI